MIVAALILGGAGSVTGAAAPALTRAQVRARTRHSRWSPAFRTRYDAAVPAGLAVAQAPAGGRRIAQGSTVRVTFSAGPRPVSVPDVGGEAAAQAQSQLRADGLRARL